MADIYGLLLKGVWDDFNSGATSVPISFGGTLTDQDAASFAAACIAVGYSVAVDGRDITVTQ